VRRVSDAKFQEALDYLRSIGASGAITQKHDGRFTIGGMLGPVLSLVLRTPPWFECATSRPLTREERVRITEIMSGPVFFSSNLKMIEPAADPDRDPLWPQQQRPDILLGVPLVGRPRKEAEERAYILHCTQLVGTDEAQRRAGAGGAMTTVCERVDLDHPIFPESIGFARCADCGCDLQYAAAAAAAMTKLCVCCTARRLREYK